MSALPPELEKIAQRASELALAKLAVQRHDLRARDDELIQLLRDLLSANPLAGANAIYREVRAAKIRVRREKALDLIREVRALLLQDAVPARPRNLSEPALRAPEEPSS
jgi:hypothetical protein